MDQVQITSQPVRLTIRTDKGNTVQVWGQVIGLEKMTTDVLVSLCISAFDGSGARVFDVQRQAYI